MVVYAGQGDPRRSMALLWGAKEPGSGRPGPKPGLSVDVIVEAGIAVADEEGMAALSMRKVGERLGRTGMALYTYVPSKGELVDLMYDRVLAELPADYDLSGGWRAAVTDWAARTWAFYLRHPWVLQVSQARPVLGPNEFTLLESLVRILRETGLGPGTLRGVVASLMDFVRGSARTVAESRQAPSATGVSDEEWWQARASLLEEVAPGFAGRFPLVRWLESEPLPRDGAGEDEPYLAHKVNEAFAVGLTVLLDGVEVAMRRAAADMS
ncbi:TetR/AcrR family transcriptional regulator [Nonomuraea sp. NN258]|uniref:TetR/AcrR family transcriptional regulator n=1 Tax=Nonomuraea antri TaxID=2730852 RepID=UPI00156940EC|nr:TetR/AcrR family transcriptional regulator [Nonomuraea antri]NRQ36120.1 TetR/AcrR family transcriptional regulator [Nonomuraea antri]